MNSDQTDYEKAEEKAIAQHLTESGALTMREPTSNERANMTLAAVDAIVTKATDEPQEQLGVLLMAVVLATRRLCTSRAIFDRGRRMRVIKAVAVETEKKLRKYVSAPG
jgi:hypothetical protein